MKQDIQTLTDPLRAFQTNRIELTAPYPLNAFQGELRYLLDYDPDRLLAGFLENRGLEPKADIYPGWESTEIRGHTLGHYLSACAQAYEQSGDARLKQRLDYVVEQLSLCQFDNGYLSAFPETLIDNVEQQKPAWVPWYTIHKIIAGLIAVCNATYSITARDTVIRLGNWVASRTERWSDELQAIVLSVEYGGMNDCLYDLYKLSGDKRHLEAAGRFDEWPLFEALAQGRDMLPGKHANTTIPKFVGALNRYRTLGESERICLEAAANFWEIVVCHHSYMTGGNSESEHFGQPDILDAKRSDITCETCNSYNMLKLTRELFQITGDRKYADFYERTYINAILSSQHPDTAMTTYFQPMATGYFKVYSSPFSHFWCCTGTGMESFTKLGDSLYFHNENRLYVTQFADSALDWREQEATIVQRTDIPGGNRVELTVKLPDGDSRLLELHIRIPYWLSGPIEASLNGRPIEAAQNNGFAVVRRHWNDGDTLRLILPMAVIASRLPDNPRTVGFQYGPVVLSAALGTEDLSEAHNGVIVSVPTRKMPVKDVIVPVGLTPEQWIDNVTQHLVRDNDTLAFRLKGTDEDERLVFTPHYEQHRERYGIYWHIVEPDSPEWRRHLEQAEWERRLKEATIDSVQVGNDQYELQHDVSGEATFGGAWEGQNGRLAREGGWFRYRLTVNPEEQTVLQAMFSALHAGSTVHLYVNGQLLASEQSPSVRKREFYTKMFQLPPEWIGGSRQAEFLFKVEGGTSGIYGTLRTMRPLQ